MGRNKTGVGWPPKTMRNSSTSIMAFFDVRFNHKNHWLKMLEKQTYEGVPPGKRCSIAQRTLKRLWISPRSGQPTKLWSRLHHVCDSTVWCSGSLCTGCAWFSCISNVREPISLHQAVHVCERNTCTVLIFERNSSWSRHFLQFFLISSHCETWSFWWNLFKQLDVGERVGLLDDYDVLARSITGVLIFITQQSFSLQNKTN